MIERLQYLRLTKRRLLLGAATLTVVYVVFWIVLFICYSNPARHDAVALYDRLRPGMSAEEFNQITQGEPIPQHVRASLGEDLVVLGGTHCVIWNHTERFELLAYFGSHGLVQKTIMEEGWGNVPRYRRFLEEYLGVPSPSVYKHWP
jgi:hypothetical protein